MVNQSLIHGYNLLKKSLRIHLRLALDMLTCLLISPKLFRIAEFTPDLKFSVQNCMNAFTTTWSFLFTSCGDRDRPQCFCQILIDLMSPETNVVVDCSSVTVVQFLTVLTCSFPWPNIDIPQRPYKFVTRFRNIMERIIFEQIETYFDNNYLNTDDQHAYRTGYFTCKVERVTFQMYCDTLFTYLFKKKV